MLAILSLYGRSWASLEAYVGGLGCTWLALGAYVGDLGPLLGLYWRSWAVLVAAACSPESLLEPHVGGLGPLLGPIVAVLGRSWALCGRSGAEKCEEHGCLENVFISRAGVRSAASGVVFGCSCGLCSRSWAALSVYVVGLGLLLGPMFSILGPLLSQERPKNAPRAPQQRPSGQTHDLHAGKLAPA